ncbi:MAG TPA: hypothetical protein ENN09_06475 [Planctomycetes bacterium]|nr:hypothetical protein [Planctomycetota bacterium]
MDSVKVCDVKQLNEDVTVKLLVPELRLEMRDSFAAEIRAAVSIGTGTVTFDLTSLERIFSMFLGVLMDGIWQAKKNGRSVRIVLRPDMYEHFREMGIQNAAELVSRE